MRANKKEPIPVTASEPRFSEGFKKSYPLESDKPDSGIIGDLASAKHPCTCHPDDNPPVPCAEKYAFSECKSGSASTDKIRERCLECGNIWLRERDLAASPSGVGQEWESEGGTLITSGESFKIGKYRAKAIKDAHNATLQPRDK